VTCEPKLAWEAEADKEPKGVGICVSGGGVRSASFGLGVLAALQEKGKLLYGKHPADLLSAVSGGSYVSATAILNARALEGKPDDPPLLSEQSPETEYLINHGRYLISDGAPKALVQILWRLAWNLFSAAAALAMVAALLVFSHWLVQDTNGLDKFEDLAGSDIGKWVALGAFFLSVTVLMKFQYSKRRLGGEVALPVGALIFLLFGYGAVTALESVQSFTSDHPWTVYGFIALGIVLLIGSAALSGNWVARVVDFLADLVPRIGLAIALAYLVHALDANIDGPAGYVWVLLAATGIALTAQDISQRVGLHRWYRDRLAWCYAIHRGSAGLERCAEHEMLSTTAPPEDGVRFPRLLICATANINVKGADGPLQPYVYSYDQCGIPGAAGGSMSTHSLELGREANELLSSSRDPILSLMGAVAATGAAISPALGRKTIPAMRPLLALANTRLGKWLPNPLNEDQRAQVDDQGIPWRYPRRRVLGSGWDELLPEIFGVHSANADRVYVTDGGHDDNLGLSALLRARCKTIWAVDAGNVGSAKQSRPRWWKPVIRLDQGPTPEEAGSSVNIREAIKIAEQLDVEITHVDTEVDRGYARWSIKYKGGETGTLITIGLHDPAGAKAADTPREACLRSRLKANQDRRFPRHPTFRYQWFKPERVQAYRDLGELYGLRAWDAVGASPGDPSGPPS
jgi:predicted acylesterase/phospholipase RssA